MAKDSLGAASRVRIWEAGEYTIVPATALSGAAITEDLAAGAAVSDAFVSGTFVSDVSCSQWVLRN